MADNSDNLVYKYTEQMIISIKEQEENFLLEEIYNDIQENKNKYNNVIKYNLSRDRIIKLLKLGAIKEKELERK